MEINIKLKEIMKERGITQVQLSEMTGIRQASLSVIARNAQEALNLRHLAAIMKALEITDIREMLEVVEE